MKTLLVCALAIFATAAFADFDLGDLPPCNYPTFFGNPAHSMSGKAWLGDCITAEDNPHAVNQDPCDDGVQFQALPWMPCEMVSVIVTVHAGPNYASNPLWLNAWKDGNLDGDFCDTLCDGEANEWIIQDVPVTPGTFTFNFRDPGVFNLGQYDGVFRFRLTGRTIGRMGFGFYDPFDCPDMPMCGNFGADSLGEVEDYVIPDAQLAVTLDGVFDAIPGDSRVTLNWRTASETSNDRFEILRDGDRVQTVRSQGNTATGHSYSWTDDGVTNGTSYTYTLLAVDIANQSVVVGTDNATPAATVPAVAEYALRQNYPNPFNPSTSITFDVVENGHVSLRVFNMIGQEVATLVNSNMNSGRHTISFDATALPSGLYIYRMEANGFTDQKKMLLMK